MRGDNVKRFIAAFLFALLVLVAASISWGADPDNGIWPQDTQINNGELGVTWE